MSYHFKCEKCGTEFQRDYKTARFCSVECQTEWQRSISWEERIGKEKADKIRKRQSFLSSGDKNPSTNPDVAKKISESVKTFLKENPRLGEKNPFYGKHHTEEFKKRHSENKKGKWAYNEQQYRKLCERTPRGDNHPNWKGGISTLPYAFGFDKDLKKRVKQKYNNKCVLCGEAEKMLCSHHIDYDKTNNDIGNLVPLCAPCHSRTNYNREKWIAFFKAFLKEKNCG